MKVSDCNITSGKSGRSTRLFRVRTKVTDDELKDFLLRGHVTAIVKVINRKQLKILSTNMNRPSSPIINRLRTTKDGFAFEPGLRGLVYSAIIPAATASWLLTTCATHLATFEGLDSVRGALSAATTRLGTTCVDIWLSA